MASDSVPYKPYVFQSNQMNRRRRNQRGWIDDGWLMLTTSYGGSLIGARQNLMGSLIWGLKGGEIGKKKRKEESYTPSCKLKGLYSFQMVMTRRWYECHGASLSAACHMEFVDLWAINLYVNANKITDARFIGWFWLDNIGAQTRLDSPQLWVS